MARRERKTWILFPEYFDKNLSRSEARRVPSDLAVDSPSQDEIGDILDSWDIPNRIEDHKHHPSRWYERNGMIIIPKQKGNKQELIKKIGEELKKRRKD
ncbi:MAG: signal recognition particle subunit SRP19/SEC65 family protein [Candidatus Natronoplasma sp.]